MRLILAVLLGLAGSVPSYAQAYEKVLVPIAFVGEVPGGFGSRWTSSLKGYNDSSRRLWVTGSPNCPFTCDRLIVEPGAPFDYGVGFTRWIEPQVVGAFLYLWGEDNIGIEHAELNLRIQDVSRQGLTWGTEIPIVRESEYKKGRAQLLNVPTDERFRQSVRIFDWDALPGDQIQMRVYRGDSPIATIETLLTLQRPDEPLADPPLLTIPAQFEIAHLAGTYPELLNAGPVRIELIAVDRTTKFWAFSSITNNETQQVTTITPQ